jgi:putative addiction module component (TIGR02574 family)
MDAATEKLLEQALALPLAERSEFAARLNESLGDEFVEPPEDVEAAWARELARRVEEVESGAAELVAWSEVRRELFEP